MKPTFSTNNIINFQSMKNQQQNKSKNRSVIRKLHNSHKNVTQIHHKVNCESKNKIQSKLFEQLNESKQFLNQPYTKIFKNKQKKTKQLLYLMPYRQQRMNGFSMLQVKQNLYAEINDKKNTDQNKDQLNSTKKILTEYVTSYEDFEPNKKKKKIFQSNGRNLTQKNNTSIKHNNIIEHQRVPINAIRQKLKKRFRQSQYNRKMNIKQLSTELAENSQKIMMQTVIEVTSDKMKSL